MKISVLAAVAFGLAASVALATTPAYDVTGHWTGSAQRKGKPAAALTADLTQTGKTIGGSLVTVGEETLNCTVTGHLAAKPVLHLRCDDGSKITLRGRLDTSANTYKGTFSLAQHHKHHGGAFMLTKTI
jgi:hypothetical protein